MIFLMKKIRFAIPVVALFLAVAAHAQGGDVGSGCDASPENPTVILAALGSLGAAGAVVRNRLATHRRKKQ